MPDDLKWNSGSPWKSGISIWKIQSNRTVSRKVDRERITIGSISAHRFGLRIFARDAFFFKHSSENVSNDIFYFGDFLLPPCTTVPPLPIGHTAGYSRICISKNPKPPLDLRWIWQLWTYLAKVRSRISKPPWTLGVKNHAAAPKPPGP